MAGRVQACRLQIAPPTLGFSRQLRRSVDSTISFTPSSTRHEVIHRRAHIFVLTDLFLMCERMSATEKAEKAKEVLDSRPDRVGDGGPLPEMWLLYPPLAGRHLSVLSGGVENELIVTVMQRENFLLTFDDRQTREEILADLQACIAFASDSQYLFVLLRDSMLTLVERVPDSKPGGKSNTVKSIQTESPRPVDHEVPHRRPLLASHATETRNPRMASSDQSHQPAPHPVTSTPHHGRGSVQINPQQNMMAPPMRNASLPVASTLPRLYPAPGQASAQHPQLLTAHPSHYGAVPPRTASAPILQPGPVPQIYRNAPQAQYPPNHAGPSHLLSASGNPAYRSRSTEPVPPNAGPRYQNIATCLPHLSPIERSHAMPGVLDEPDSPLDDPQQMQAGPAIISARMKCKVFLKHGHQQWKSLGAAKLSLYVQRATNIKQLVVEADTKDETMLISTIVLTDGVERVAKTGVAVEISDMNGARTGIIYMIQLRDEDSAAGLFGSLISGSDRARSLSVGRKA